MAGAENPVIAALDNANALQEKIRTRVRWLATQMSDKELLAAETWLAEIVQATQDAQAELKELRRLEHERPVKGRSTAERKDAAEDALKAADERQMEEISQFF
jgi:hypothetical protein